MNTKEHELTGRMERGCVCETSRSNLEFPVVSGTALAVEFFQALRLVLRTQPRSLGCIRVNSCLFVVTQ